MCLVDMCAYWEGGNLSEQFKIKKQQKTSWKYLVLFYYH